MRCIRPILLLFGLYISLGNQCLANSNPADVSKTIAEYEELIKYYRYYKPDSAVFFAKAAMELAERTHDSQGKALILLQQGMMDDNEGEFASAEKKYQEALEIFQKAEAKQGIASATIRLGVVALRNGNYDNATENFLDALKISESIQDTAGMVEATYSISWAYLDNQDLDSALQYLKIAEQLDEQIPFSNLTLNIYNHLGVTYTKLKEYEKAKFYLEKGIPLSDAPAFYGFYITMNNNLANVYAEEGNIEQAMAIQTKALTRAKAMHNYLRELQVLSGLFKTLRNRDPAQAEAYLQQAIALAREKKSFKQEMRYLKLITNHYQKQGDFQNAFQTQSREYALADSVFYTTMSQNIEALKAEYELSKSKARVEELSYINRKNELELQKTRIFGYLTLAGIGALLLILGLLYNQYRIKQKANKKINKKNITLQLLVNEKEWLLKEIHHRVKNNLQIVMSLLNTQSAYLENEAALFAIRESQHRMQAMSLIHQKLYQSDNIASIDMPSYIRDLVNYLKESYNIDHRIRFEIQVDALKTDVSQAVPLGLILNEAITNAIKYAFPDKQQGIVSIKMQVKSDQLLQLSVSDNGVGFPPGFDIKKSNSLGMNLMQGLTQQLGGNIIIESHHGLSISIYFKNEKMIGTNAQRIRENDTQSVSL